MKRIIKGDKVKVRAGKSKGHIGRVLSVDGDFVVVEGANLVHKTVKPNPNIQEKGGIKTIEAPIHCSNVALYDSESQGHSKVGYRVEVVDGVSKKVRYYKKSNKIVESIRG